MNMYDTDLNGFVSDLSLEGLADSTISTYASCLRKWRTWAEGTLTIRSAKDWLATLTPWSAFMGGRAIRKYVAWYAGEYEVPNWAADVPCREPRHVPPQTVATEADFEAMLAVCEADSQRVKGLRDAAILHVLRFTGLRRGEAAAMEWNDIDLDSGILMIPKSKTRKARPVRLNRATLKALRRYSHELDDWELKNRRYSDQAGVWVSLSRRWLPVLSLDRLSSVSPTWQALVTSCPPGARR